MSARRRPRAPALREDRPEVPALLDREAEPHRRAVPTRSCRWGRKPGTEVCRTLYREPVDAVRYRLPSRRSTWSGSTTSCSTSPTSSGRCRSTATALGLTPERVDEWRDGKAPFPSARVNANTVIDFVAAPRTGENANHVCLVIEPTDLDALRRAVTSTWSRVPPPVGARWATPRRSTSTIPTATPSSSATTPAPHHPTGVSRPVYDVVDAGSLPG